MQLITGALAVASILGQDSILIKPKRGIGPIKAQVTIEEIHLDELEITDQPVESGVRISDHAWRRPAELTLKCGWSNSPGSQGLISSLNSAITGTVGGITSLLGGNSSSQVKEIYAKMLALQRSRELMDVFTGKRVYRNMMIKSLSTTTDKETEQALLLTIVLKEVIIAVTRVLTISAPAENQASPGTTSSVLNNGAKQLMPTTSANLAAARRAINNPSAFVGP